MTSQEKFSGQYSLIFCAKGGEGVYFKPINSTLVKIHWLDFTKLN